MDGCLCISISMDVQGKAVIVVGGGDTGTDCIGTSVRHGAKQACPHPARHPLSRTCLDICLIISAGVQ